MGYLTSYSPLQQALSGVRATTKNDGAAAAVDAAVNVATVIGWVVAGAAVGLAVALLLAVAVRFFGQTHRNAIGFLRRTNGFFRLCMMVAGGWIAYLAALYKLAGTNPPEWAANISHGFLIALILACTGLMTRIVKVLEDVALRSASAADQQDAAARKLRTQAQIMRRLGVTGVIIIGLAAVLLTFPTARTIGASMLASAGIVSVVVGLAAQTTLANVIAGLQVAFTDAIRVDDIVVVKGEYGYIEEITLTYVVVRVWDDRRLILPSKYFATEVFENWTRRAVSLLGWVDFDLDWRVPVRPMRAKLVQLLESTDLWDGEYGVLQVRDATGGAVRIRALVSANSADNMFALKYFLRENLLEWIQLEATSALPRTRILTGAEDYEEAAAPRPSLQPEEIPDPVKRPTFDHTGELGGRAIYEQREERLKRALRARLERRRAEKEDLKSNRFDPERIAKRHSELAQPSSEQTITMSPQQVREQLLQTGPKPPADSAPPPAHRGKPQLRRSIRARAATPGAWRGSSAVTGRDLTGDDASPDVSYGGHSGGNSGDGGASAPGGER